MASASCRCRTRPRSQRRIGPQSVDLRQVQATGERKQLLSDVEMRLVPGPSLISPLGQRALRGISSSIDLQQVLLQLSVTLGDFRLEVVEELELLSQRKHVLGAIIS